jgi:lysophospholipid acyltransferase (LPLAT)-like uncharacterized protein
VSRSDREASLLDDLKLRAASGAGLVLHVLLTASYRLKVLGRSHAQRRRAGEDVRCVYSVWHGDIWHLVHAMRGQEVRVMVSEHRDGEVITRIVHALGYETVRGSSTRGGARALLGLARAAREGTADPLLTVDGPRGPAGEVKEGVVFVASRTGLPVVPMGVATDRCWRARSWDRHALGKPFARVVVVYGDEIPVPEDAGREELVDRWVPAVAEGMRLAAERARMELGLPAQGAAARA